LKICRYLVFFLLLVSAIYYLAPAAYFAYWTSWSAQTKETSDLFSTEAEVGGRGIANTPLTSLHANEAVDVISDTYGKDYSACYIRTHSGTRGWVSCTALARK
jgi:hypothetical protein